MTDHTPETARACAEAAAEALEGVLHRDSSKCYDGVTLSGSKDCPKCGATVRETCGRIGPYVDRLEASIRAVVPALAAELTASLEREQRLREALAFYADMTGDGYDVMVASYGLSTELGCVIKDGGDKARALLAPAEEM